MLLVLQPACSDEQAGQPTTSFATRDWAQEQAEIVRAALVYAAKTVPPYVDEMCVNGLLKGSGLDEQRAHIASMSRSVDDADLQLAMSAGGMGWTKPHIEGNRYPDVSPQLEAELTPIVASILARETSPFPRRQRIPESWVPDPIEYSDDEDWLQTDCQSLLSMSAPAVEREFAFIDTSFTCGALCGEGGILVLRRMDDGWRVIARAMTWIA